MAEGGGTLDRVSIAGDKVTIETVMDGLAEPTAVAKVGETAWVAEGQLSHLFLSSHQWSAAAAVPHHGGSGWTVKSYVLLHHQVVTAMPHGSTKPGWPPGMLIASVLALVLQPAGATPSSASPPAASRPHGDRSDLSQAEHKQTRAGALDLPLSRRDNVFVERLGVTESLNVGAMVALIFLFLNLIEPYRGPLTPTHAINSEIGEGPIGVSNLDTLCLSRLCAS
jgi:hypothetical protein